MLVQKIFEGTIKVPRTAVSSILKGPLRKKRPRAEANEKNAACFSHRKVRLHLVSSAVLSCIREKWIAKRALTIFVSCVFIEISI